MSGKHLRKIVVSGVVALMLLTGNAYQALAYGGNYDVVLTSTVGDVHVVDITEIDVETGTVESGPLYLQNNFKEMRRGLDGVFETAQSMTGKKTGLLYVDSKGDSSFSPSYFEALGSKCLQDKYNEKNDRIKEISNGTFTDVTGNDWFAKNIPLAIYYKVINGYEDGTFKGNNNVTTAEMSKIMAVALEGTEMSAKSEELAGLGNNWFNSYYSMVWGILPYSASSNITVEYLNSNMSRSEVAYTMAKVLDNGHNELSSYISRANNGNVAGYFNDLTPENVCTSDETLANEQWHMSEGRIPARFAASIMYLKDKGIMQGDDLGNCNALSGVTRAETVALTERMAFKGVNYTKGQFSNSNLGVVANAKDDKTKNWIYSMDDVINPEADVKYQYTFNDMNLSNKNQVMRGEYGIEKQQVNHAYSKKVVDEVVASVKFENGVVTFTVPDIKSDYHEIKITGTFDYIQRVNDIAGPVYYLDSSKESGTISWDSKNCDKEASLYIMLEGREDKPQSAGKTYGVFINLLTGEITEANCGL